MNDWWDYLEHSAKGVEWKNHKYIRKEGNRYIYPEDLKKSTDDKKSVVQKNLSGAAKAAEANKKYWQNKKEQEEKALSAKTFNAPKIGAPTPGKKRDTTQHAYKGPAREDTKLNQLATSVNNFFDNLFKKENAGASRSISNPQTGAKLELPNGDEIGIKKRGEKKTSSIKPKTVDFYEGQESFGSQKPKVEYADSHNLTYNPETGLYSGVIYDSWGKKKAVVGSKDDWDTVFYLMQTGQLKKYSSDYTGGPKLNAVAETISKVSEIMQKGKASMVKGREFTISLFGKNATIKVALPTYMTISAQHKG